MPILEHFDILAPLYDRVIRPRDPAEMVRLAALPVKGALLDAGGGTGRASHKLITYVDQVVVADLSAGMLQQAAAKNNLIAVCTHTEALPFRNHSFERVIMVDALHHIINPAHTAGELWRVLKPGGRIVIEEPDIHTFAVKLIALAEKIALMRSHILPAAQIAALFAEPQATVSVKREEFTTWVIVDKPEAL